ncbi:rab17, putative [Entamoeba invadens IP1]|uniref:Rab17, putative n=1 Tax=Entamoeba invadens IP1 TaxID=370355 RepID=A0A0A1U6S2_ENTIV|nr:rab17, putative [Entamoeba invadens IP1]ELP87531.1 rab17, putative [Entamoeba invadens IP1]|eukprot:XP_004254302.1 rab17, putative [Entamoeba invadens IP1]
MDEQNDVIRMKVLVVGGPASGKTSMIHQFCDGAFEEIYQPTIGVEFSSKFVTYEGRQVEIRLWDVAGQDYYAAMTRVYFSGAISALVVCDITSKDSIEAVVKWKANIDDRVLFNEQKIPVILVGNKSDLLNEKELTNVENQLKEIKENEQFTGVELISAKTSKNIDTCMEKITKAVMTQFGDFLVQKQTPKVQSNQLEFKKVDKTNGCCQ